MVTSVEEKEVESERLERKEMKKNKDGDENEWVTSVWMENFRGQYF